MVIFVWILQKIYTEINDLIRIHIKKQVLLYSLLRSLVFSYLHKLIIVSSKLSCSHSSKDSSALILQTFPQKRIQRALENQLNFHAVKKGIFNSNHSSFKCLKHVLMRWHLGKDSACYSMKIFQRLLEGYGFTSLAGPHSEVVYLNLIPLSTLNACLSSSLEVFKCTQMLNKNNTETELPVRVRMWQFCFTYKEQILFLSHFPMIVCWTDTNNGTPYFRNPSFSTYTE